jgi:hypothetical protein
MTVNELIQKLENIKAKYGDLPCVVSIDTDHAFNETNLLDVDVLTYNITEFNDGKIEGYKISLHGELTQQED